MANETAMENSTAPQNSYCKEDMDGISLTIFIFLNISSSLAAFLGNTLVLVVICLLKNNRNASHYFIASLSLADFSVGLIMNPILVTKAALGIWQGDHWLSKMADFMWLQTTTATAFSLCAVSFDRYASIVGVFRYNKVLTEHKAIQVCGIIWFASVLTGSMRLFIPNPSNQSILWMASTVLTVLLPLFIIGYCYSKIYHEAKLQLKKIAANVLNRKQMRETLHNKKAACTVAIVTGLFFILWIPSFIASVVEILVAQDCKVKVYVDYAWFWVALLCFSSSAINPWIYAMRMREIRRLIRRSLRRETSYSDACAKSKKSGSIP